MAVASASVQITKIELWALPNQAGESPTPAVDVLNGKIGAFVQQQHLNVGSADWGSEIWLRLTVQASRTDTSASIVSTAQSLPDVLEVPKNYLDRIRLYSPVHASLSSSLATPTVVTEPAAASASLEPPIPALSLNRAGWAMQEAGDTLAHRAGSSKVYIHACFCRRQISCRLRAARRCCMCRFCITRPMP
ncbi:MAG: hypothetical protein HC765_01860 [Brachymonas sp.]|nr:hypothetical protein [Brachymonas sp.]